MSTKQLDLLVVDDHKFTRDMLGEVLQAVECKRLRFCQDGAEAFDQILSSPPDIAIVDLEMPVGGLDLLRKIRRAARSPDPSLPVIMMTSHTDRRRVMDIRNEGATDIIRKPFTAATVLGRVASVIDNPRTFVESRSFVGPDRRRSGAKGYAGPFRRATDPKVVDL